jgi:iron complex outermembrane receptor protein
MGVDRAFADLKSYYLQGSYTDENTLIKAITWRKKLLPSVGRFNGR